VTADDFTFLQWLSIAIFAIFGIAALGAFAYSIYHSLRGEETGSRMSRARAVLLVAAIMCVFYIATTNKSCERYAKQVSEDASER
jgi:hypothetical protein